MKKIILIILIFAITAGFSGCAVSFAGDLQKTNVSETLSEATFIEACYLRGQNIYFDYDRLILPEEIFSLYDPSENPLSFLKLRIADICEDFYFEETSGYRYITASKRETRNYLIRYLILTCIVEEDFYKNTAKDTVITLAVPLNILESAYIVYESLCTGYIPYDLVMIDGEYFDFSAVKAIFAECEYIYYYTNFYDNKTDTVLTSEETGNEVSFGNFICTDPLWFAPFMIVAEGKTDLSGIYSLFDESNIPLPIIGNEELSPAESAYFYNSGHPADEFEEKIRELYLSQS